VNRRSFVPELGLSYRRETSEARKRENAFYDGACLKDGRGKKEGRKDNYLTRVAQRLPQPYSRKTQNW